MNSNQDIAVKIETYLQNNVELPVSFNRDTDLFENRIVDSIGVIELVAFLEKEFKISIPFETISIVEIRCVNSLVNFVSIKSRK